MVLSALIGIIIFIDYDFLSEREVVRMGKDDREATESDEELDSLGSDDIDETTESDSENGTIEISKTEEED